MGQGRERHIADDSKPAVKRARRQQRRAVRPESAAVRWNPARDQRRGRLRRPAANAFRRNARDLRSGVQGHRPGHARRQLEPPVIALTVDDEHHHAFVYANGVMQDLNERIDADGWELIYALGINDRGQIVAIGHHDGNDRIVLLTPRGS